MRGSAYRNVLDIWRRYWRAYGGFAALRSSPYLHAAVLTTFLCWPVWTSPNWWEDPVGVLPDLLGFTLGGLAILLGLFDTRIVHALSHPSHKLSDTASTTETTSTLQEIIASFVHFIVVQSAALLVAFICKGAYVPIPAVFGPRLQSAGTQVSALVRPFIWGISYCLFVYAVILVLATTMAVFRLSRMLERVHLTLDDDSNTTNIGSIRDSCGSKHRELDS